ncbi:OmpA family protein [Acuticoccus sp.]|uniref:OmpA family protein n=1 Tax=Acuticoccus sp. TaxID=1904378 RepID=UPI003B5249FB
MATTALALAAPAAAQDLACADEVDAFMETIRDDDAFARIESLFSDYETRLVEARGVTEGECFAVLAEAQTAIADEGTIIEGATDEQALQRTERLSAMVAEAERTTVAVQAVPAQVAVQPSEADVTVEQEATEVDVAQRASEIEVRQPAADVSVAAPQQRVDVRQPEARVDVQAAAPKVAVMQPAPRVQVEQPQPEIAVQQTQPRVRIEQPEPEIIVRQFQPEVEIRQPQPTITVEQTEPEVAVVQPEPIVTVEAAEPVVDVAQAQPNVTVEQARPEVNVTQRQPEVAVVQPEARVEVEEQEPVVNVTQAQPQVDVTQAAPQVEVEQREATVAVSQPEAEVDVSQSRPAVSADIASGAEVSATREEGGPDVSVMTEDAPTIVIAEAEVRELEAAESIAVIEVEFGFDSAEVTTDQREDVLREAIDAYRTMPEAAVLLTGHASPIGDADYNMELSERRVDAVRDALVELGVEEARIRTRGAGETNTEVPAGEDERSEENRRVEIRVIDASAISG